MKIVVTGHLGTLGAPLVRRLRDMDHDVTGIDLRHSFDGRRADIAEYRQLEAVFDPDVETVYHLAAEFGRHNGEDYYEQVWRTNVVGTKNVLRLQERHGFRLIFASSSEVYGEQSAEYLHEDMVAARPECLSNDYAVSKWVNEAQIANSRARHDTQTMVLRFFNAYGPGEEYHSYRSVVCLFAYRALKNLPYTVFENYHRVFQYVDDLIATVAGACERFHDGETINVGGVEYRSVEDLHEVVSRAAGVDPMRNTVERQPFDMHNVTNKRPDIAKASGFLNHRPRVTLEDGVDHTVRWMRARHGA